MTEHPDVTFDLWDLYRFDVEDVFAGRRAPEWAWGLIDRLDDEPWSRWRAKRRGGDEHWREHLGWSSDTYIAALAVDIQQFVLAVTDAARTGKKPHLPSLVPRPTSAQAPAEEVDDVDRELSDEQLAAMVRELDM